MRMRKAMRQGRLVLLSNYQAQGVHSLPAELFLVFSHPRSTMISLVRDVIMGPDRSGKSVTVTLSAFRFLSVAGGVSDFRLNPTGCLNWCVEQA